jgi:hypothetical protein
MDKYFWLRILLNVFEFVAFILGIIFWKKVKHSYWKWFVFYCGLILFIELFAKFIGYGLKNPKLNSDLYFFIGIPVQFIFFSWLFYKWFEKPKDKLLPVMGLIIYLLSWITDLLFLRHQRMWFSSFSYTVGNLAMVLMVTLFFLRFVNSNEILKYKQSNMFWVCLGLLVFYLGTLPFYGLRNYLYQNYKSVFYPYWDISFILGCIMYVFFSFSFIWGKPK